VIYWAYISVMAALRLLSAVFKVFKTTVEPMD